MKYKVLKSFSYKFNGSRKEVKKSDTIFDSEIQPSILKYALDNGKIEPLRESKQIKSEKISIPTPLKKVERISDKLDVEVKEDVVQAPMEKKIEVEVLPIVSELASKLPEKKSKGKSKKEKRKYIKKSQKVEKEEKKLPPMGVIELTKEGLNGASDSQLKSVANQMGIVTENKKLLINKILKSGV